MALKREMTINIGPDGKVTISVDGVSGGDCVDFSKFLEEELGEVQEREFTEEFYHEVTLEEELVIGGPTPTATSSS